MKIKVSLNKQELRVLMHLVDSMPIEVAKGMDFNQGQIAELYLKLSDGWELIEIQQNLEN